jgi:hypothetical protein
VSYITVGKTFSGTLPQWLFSTRLPARARKAEAAQERMNTGELHD